MNKMDLKQIPIWFNELTSIMSEGLYLTDKKGLVLFTNKAFTDITGIKGNELIGKNIQAYLDEQYVKGTYKRLDIDDMEHVAQNKVHSASKPDSLWTVVTDRKAEVSYASFLVNDGLEKVVLFLGHPIFDEQGDIENVMVILQDVTQNSALKDELTRIEDKTNRYLSELKYHREAQLDQKVFVGSSKAIKAIRKVIENISNTNVSVLIQGETGVGKEIVAHEIYKLSQRKDKPYIKINCSAIPENLLETELFGYEPGAFSGAQKKTKIGYFEMANHGTLLLDEIGDMSFSLQAKLLRVLQDQVITRVGGVKSIELDVRIIASTSKDLIQEIQKGLFRMDLYYRLNIMPIVIPPLRERKTDIAEIAQYFLDQFSKKYNRLPVLNQEVQALLETYFWPGNVRELKNILERIVIVNGDGMVESQQVLALLGGEPKSFELSMNTVTDLNLATEQFQKKIIENALRKYKSTYKVAEALGVTQSTISRKAKALGITEW